ncbi:hypothetical protein ACQP00_11025 [Dactylosporangium sp. CS-047395]|uniref:hypothetical protein n=1 Tax=Dactylosporangium sp. CS-047395 TaxID=3239936 RepID=UPI003D8BAB7E
MRWLLGAAGLALLGYGVYGWLDAPTHELAGRLVFAAVALVAHDFVVVPLVLATAALVTRFVPEIARGPVRAGLAVAAALTVVALPFVIGAGRIADNPSAFPQHYGRGLAVLLAATALVTAAWIAARLLRARRRR